MDDDGVPLLLLTLSAIDSDGMTVGCLRMDFGDVTINRGVESASEGISLLPPMSNCTLGGASTCTLGGVSICTLGDASICTLGEWAWILDCLDYQIFRRQCWLRDVLVFKIDGVGDSFRSCGLDENDVASVVIRGHCQVPTVA
jgi:hypothetical protein